MLCRGDLVLIRAIGAHESAHVAAITSTIEELGGEPVPPPTLKYPDGTFRDRATFLRTASVFEEVGVTAYQGQITSITDPELLIAAAAIGITESRHAAIIALLAGGNPLPAGIERPKDMATVLAMADPFIKGSARLVSSKTRRSFSPRLRSLASRHVTRRSSESC